VNEQLLARITECNRRLDVLILQAKAILVALPRLHADALREETNRQRREMQLQPI
jgi:hypothetical protein